MSTSTKSLITIIGMILCTTAALAAIVAMGPRTTTTIASAFSGSELSVSSEVVQEKILKGGDGRVAVALSLTAPDLPETGDKPFPAADLVIVLDRSGSMQGRKLADARQAVIHLLDQLGSDDRLALVTYSDGVQIPSPLVPVTAATRRHLVALVESVSSGGGTNLGGGLGQGIDMLRGETDALRQRKIILISDGLANQGITDTAALARMAATAVENRFSVSTVGVGLDFNEMLMTSIADHGAGSYHFLEDPRSFARVFENELTASRRVAISGLSLRLPLEPGVRLIDAGGYPIRMESGAAIVHPGNLLSGQQKTLFLTFAAPTDREGTVTLGRLQIGYTFDGNTRIIDGAPPLTVACVPDPAAVVASIKKEAWGDQVVQEEFSQLKAAVAADIRDGDKPKAETRIREYEARQSAINAVVGSAKVSENLSEAVHELRKQVNDTFSGPPAAVAEKKKQASKALQYDSYQERRDKK